MFPPLYYRIKIETEYGTNNFCKVVSHLPLEDVSDEVIMRVIEYNDELAGALIRTYAKKHIRILVERISFVKYLKQ